MGESLDLLDRLVLEARQDLQRRRHLMDSDRFEQAVAARTAGRCSTRPPNPAMCVSTEIAAAPPSVYACARSAGR